MEALAFVAVAITQLEINSHKALSHCLALKRTVESARSSEQSLWSLKLEYSTEPA